MSDDEILISKYIKRSKESEKYYEWENNGEEKSARNENFFVSIKLFACPKLTWLSFIVIISIIEFIVYIISLSIYGLSDSSFLAPNFEALKIMGAADAKSTKNDYHFHRLILPLLLHANLKHISGNIVVQL